MNLKTVLLAFILLGSMGSGFALTFEELKVSFASLRLKEEGEFEANTTALSGKYREALGSLLKSYQEQGLLDQSLLISAEIKRIEQGIWPLPPLSTESPAKLKSARKIYVEQFVGYKKDIAERIITASDKMQQLLEEKVVELTREGDLDTARKARTYLQDLSTDTKINDYKLLIKRLKNPGQSPAALRIRRYGDPVEVLVRLDTAGKVSMASPISNTMEITGGRKERGETEAKSLGEFLGAEKYDPYPQTVFSHTFDDANDLPLQAVQFDVTPVEFDGKKAIGLTVQAAATNPMVTIAKANLPQKAASCEYRISYEYLIPKSNEKLTTLSIQQGPGFEIEKRTSRKKGVWQSCEATSLSQSEHRFLRIYVGGSPGTKVAEIRNESFWLRSLKVDIIKFSAYICEEFGESGESKIAYPEAQEQPLFAANGALLDTGND